MIVNLVILLIGLACIGYFLALGITVRFGQSLMFIWPIVGGLCILRFILWSIFYRTEYYPPRGIVIAARTIVILCLLFFFVVEGVIFAGGNIRPQNGLDYIVVLGAKVNGTQPSGALRNRIQCASEYMKENPTTIAILSGGKGTDEDISEAQCMYNGMVERGIDPARLILEEQAADTSENLRNSRAIINDETKSVGIVTNNFHIFRTLGLARKMEWKVSGIPVATTAISFPHYMMREFVGVVYETIRGNIVVRL